ncbi:hypothetical protein STSP2_02321 [Anaerohalosphaera lusitana]|uniref:Major pilin subunit n=1 Tax=Anaerohalosphaera lusitana TaxID=1936003 RepID=A0A1U9NN18_9BACT|nr:type II secretion system protein [Anaerohalosphaera lusitana]AQT69134.1 hypothetical protein STSP2_02321 [Anaerohalosphaera lusitana]
MNNKKAFTLIELLVVISIIALLLSIMMPALGMVKEKARGVVCRSNLKQWGLCYMLYAQNNDDRFARASWENSNNTWMAVLRDYYADIDEIRTCPTAHKATQGNPPQWGSAENAWRMNPGEFWMEDDDWGVGSYGENAFIRVQDPPGGSISYGGSSGKFWKSPNAKGASNVPMLMDARWQNLKPENNHAAPDTDGVLTMNWQYADVAAMRRHGDGINVVFLDQSINPVDAEDLWDLRWNREYKPRGRIELPQKLDDGLGR